MNTNHLTRQFASGNLKYILAGLFFFFMMPVMSYSQSAIHQLEVASGQKITQYGSVNSNLYFQNAIKMELVSGIASALLNSIFNDKTKNNQAAIQQAKLLAAKAAAEKHYHDSIAQAKYEKMMKSYKLLNDPNAVHFKTLSTSGITFKSLDQSAPMTMAEMERQKIIKKGISVTWNYNSWAPMQNDNTIADASATPQEDAANQYMGKAIDKIETFQGGKIAALAGRFMMNIESGTFSYLHDLNNSLQNFDYSNQPDLPKLVSNAAYKTVDQTAKAYYDNFKGKVTDLAKEKNFAWMKSGEKTLLKSSGIYSNGPGNW